MIYVTTPLNGAFIVELEKHHDERGFFARMWCRSEGAQVGIRHGFAQANVSVSYRAGTLRGLHFQHAPHEEAKLIRCVRGRLYDVIVDVRPTSSTYGEWFGVELDGDTRRMLYVPAGFAHGFQTLEDNTEAMYLVSSEYVPEAEDGIKWNDPVLNITWPMQVSVISKKDRAWPDFRIDVVTP